MIVVSISVATIVIAIVVYLAYLGKYNKKFEELHKSHENAVTTLAELNRKQSEEFKDVIEAQTNVILSQRKELASLNIGMDRLKNHSTTVESQKKSSEVRLGLMAENFMPFIRDYPYDHKNFRFLANPVDGIQVNDDSVIFIEFKTGGAKLSRGQKHIKELVSQGKVRFETFRVDEDGASLKLESTMENLGE
ncbi:hypothetical protein JZU46_06145 [bacterium]|nr:hypothetical protein [bacterium]